MDDKIVFKTATVGGFEKKAVLDYIYQMNEDNDFAQQKLKEKVEDLELQVKELEEQKKEAEETITLLQSKLIGGPVTPIVPVTEEPKEEVAEAPPEEKPTEEKEGFITEEIVITETEPISSSIITKVESEEKIAEISKNNAIIVDNLAKELEGLRDELRFERDRNIALNDKYKGLSDKNDEIERTSSQLGKIMLDARADSNAIVANAEEQAREIEMRAHASTDVMKETAQKEAISITNLAKAQSDEMITSATGKADELLAEAERKSTDIVDNARNLADATMFSVERQAEILLDDTKKRVSALLSLTQSTTSTTTEHIEGLKKESASIQAALRKAIEQFQTEGTALEDAIQNAEANLKNISDYTLDASIFEIPHLSEEDVEAIKKEMKQPSQENSTSNTAYNSPNLLKEPAPNSSPSLSIADDEDNNIAMEVACDDDYAVPDFASSETEETIPVFTATLEDEISIGTPMPPALSHHPKEEESVNQQDKFFLHIDSDE